MNASRENAYFWSLVEKKIGTTVSCRIKNLLKYENDLYLSLHYLYRQWFDCGLSFYSAAGFHSAITIKNIHQESIIEIERMAVKIPHIISKISNIDNASSQLILDLYFDIFDNREEFHFKVGDRILITEIAKIATDIPSTRWTYDCDRSIVYRCSRRTADASN